MKDTNMDTNMEKRSRKLGKLTKLILIAPLALIGFALFIALGGEVVKLLWNALLPSIFGWREITFWQALGLLVLCRMLFGGLGLHGSGRSRLRHRLEERWQERWRERWAERWERMTPEERERFRQGVRGHCDPGPSPGESQGS